MKWNAAHTGEKQEGDWRPDIEVFGTNSIRTRSEIEGRFKRYVAGMTPCGRAGTKVFFSVATTKDEKSEAYVEIGRESCREELVRPCRIRWLSEHGNTQQKLNNIEK